jgi:hypothetical protein
VQETYSIKKESQTIEYELKVEEDADGVYEGEVSSGLRHGEGKYFLKNGNRYEGDMCKGLMQGFGKYFWKNGNRYEDTFLQDKICG